MMRFAISFLLALTRLVIAGDDQETAAAGIDRFAKATYFVNNGYTFAINVVENGDVYYHMHTSSAHSWFGIGFGDSMKNTRMLISYLSADGGNLTNSCRIAHGHSEPVHDPSCVIEKVTTDLYAPYENKISPDGILIAHAVCRNCWSSALGALDMNNTQQPFIYAYGPNDTLHSDDLNAPLRVHQYYGTFTMDMTMATNYTGDYGRVPAPQDPALAVGHSFWAFANYFSSLPFNTGTLADWSPTVHAVFMCTAFLLIFPLGAISLRLLRRAMFHAAAQMVGVAFVVLGFGFGIYASLLYNKSKHFNSTHQIIGLLVLAALLLQVGLGLCHHLLFMRSGTPTVMGKIHRFLGISIMVVAIINGGLGLKFSQNSYIPYAVVVAIMAVIMGALAAWVAFYTRQHLYKPEKEPFAAEYGSDPPAEYEMHNAPFAHMGYVQTPRTPFFTDAKWTDDPDNYRAILARENAHRNATQDSLYTDTPASEVKNPFQTRWDKVDGP